MAVIERRANPEDKVRDRRLIPRFAHPTIRESAHQIRFWALLGLWAFVVAIVIRLAQGFTSSAELTARAVAESVAMALMAVTLHSYAASLKAYLAKETPATLATCFEKQRNVWMTTSAIAIVVVICWAIFNF